MKRKRLTENQINKIKRMRVRGHSIKHIADHMGLQYNTVWNRTKDVEVLYPKKTVKTKVKNVTPKKMAVPTPAAFDENKVREFMTGYLDGLAIKYDIPRADIDRVVFSVLELPLSVRLFG